MNDPPGTTKSQVEAGDRLGLIGERQPWLQTSWPELQSLMAWFWGIEASFITSMLESIGLLLILPLGIRASWKIAILLHGTGCPHVADRSRRRKKLGIKRSKHNRTLGYS